MKAAMVDLWMMHINTLLITESPLNLNILMQVLIKLAVNKEVHSKSQVSQMSHKDLLMLWHKLLSNNQFQLLLMQIIGNYIREESSVTAKKVSTTELPWLDTLLITGL